MDRRGKYTQSTVEVICERLRHGEGLPFLRANIYLPLQSTIDNPRPGRPQDPTLVIDLQLEGTWSYAEMVASKEFHNILAQKSWIQFDILVAFDKADVLIDQTIQRIESRL